MSDDLMNDDVRYVTLHGHRVAYRDAGHGEVLLLLHGMAGSSDSWEAVFSRLAQQYRVIAAICSGTAHRISRAPITR